MRKHGFALMRGNQLVHLIEQLLLDAVQHVEYIAVVQVERAAVDIHQIRQLAHGNVLHLLFLHQLNQPVGKQLLRPAHPAVFLLLRLNLHRILFCHHGDPLVFQLFRQFC